MARKKTKRAYLKELNEIFKDIDEDKKRIVEPLVENAAFMAVQLTELQEYIAEHGCTEEYQNGANQKGKKKSSEVEVYNVMIKNYASIIKQLCDLLPQKGEAANALLDFIKQ